MNNKGCAGDTNHPSAYPCPPPPSHPYYPYHLLLLPLSKALLTPLPACVTPEMLSKAPLPFTVRGQVGPVSFRVWEASERTHRRLSGQEPVQKPRADCLLNLRLIPQNT
ncbi:hypothetical protein E2C01_036953 [Portunus trituberculatus]|uniref:Uncharacterized protein n=1 Tax=Portunus trituberculatus TaxID=210409 RepID=A0A5B7FDG4_PORTR|nr:hypothetical protein [Portunus trituberculatus]